MLSTKNIVYREDIKSIDNKTGEIIHIKNRKISKVPRTPDFIMLFTKHLAFLEHLIKGETAVLFEILAKYVGFENLLNISAPIRASITNKLKVDKSYVNKAIQGLMKKNIIIKNSEGLLYLNPHLFGKGNWEDIHKLRHEIAYDFDFENFEYQESRKVSIIYDTEFDIKNHNIIDTQEYEDEKGVLTEEITVEKKEDSFEKTNEIQTNEELEILKEKNRFKELSIREMELKLEMKKQGLI